MPTLLRCMLLVLLLPAAGRGADQDPASITYTSAEDADADFAFQGEYQGWQRPTASLQGSLRIGLQVVAQGDGKFIAVKYLGGLPGDGWKTGERILLDGERLGNAVLLQGDLLDVQLGADDALLLDHQRRFRGRLERVRRSSPTLGAPPPEGAEILFDGSSVEALVKGRMTDEGWLAAGADSKQAWRDFRLHGEFLLPYKPFARGQDRGNSGFYLQERYELQILDSFGLEGVENECGALYKTKRPEINMCLPPLSWQTYDLDFEAPKFDANGNKLEPMRISVWQNGVPIHARAEIWDKTGNGKPEGPTPLPLRLQEHNNPVVFRNLWLVETDRPGAREIDWLRLPIRRPPVAIGVGGLEPRFAAW